jgi:hypothetical protein
LCLRIAGFGAGKPVLSGLLGAPPTESPRHPQSLELPFPNNTKENPVNLLFSIPIALLSASLWTVKVLFLGGWFAARWLAYLTWPLWATVFGIGAFVGLL